MGIFIKIRYDCINAYIAFFHQLKDTKWHNEENQIKSSLQKWPRKYQTLADKDTESPDNSVSSLSRQQTGHDFLEIRTETRQGQDTDSAVRRRLVSTISYET